MNYQITSLEGSAKEIIHRVIYSDSSQLLIPQKYAGVELEIPPVPQDGKYIGLFSSGTISNPKCIWNRYESLELNARLSALAFDVEPRHFLLMLALPWHVAGFTWLLMAEFLDCEYLFITTRKGDHELWLNTIQDTEPDYIFTVPAVLRSLYDEDWYSNNIVYGGYPIRFEEYSHLSPHCRTMYQGYGQTEAGGLISCHKRRSTQIPMQSEHLCHGFPIQGLIIQCDGSPEKPAPIYIKSPTAYTGVSYNTGDVGYLDKYGRIYVCGRAEDQSIPTTSRGKKRLIS